jgi:hypothetical protein
MLLEYFMDGFYFDDDGNLSQLPPPKAAALDRRTWKVRPCRFQPGDYLAQPNYPKNFSPSG